MLGIVRPCHHRLGTDLYREWMSHLCGMCLTLRDLHGQVARLATNFDGVVISALVEAQGPAEFGRRDGGRCALRAFRHADVVDASAGGVRLAATMSLVLAAAKLRDHVADRDGMFARWPATAIAIAGAGKAERVGQRTGAGLGFDTTVLTSAVARQVELERSPGLALSEVTEPTETALGALFGHTAVLAGQPGNVDRLTVAGQRFGRIAHLLDAVEDLPEDQEAGAYNPLLATGTGIDEASAACHDALRGLRESIEGVNLPRPALIGRLLVPEVTRTMHHSFAQAREPHGIPAMRNHPRTRGPLLPCLPASGGHRAGVTLLSRYGAGLSVGGDEFCDAFCESCGEGCWR